MGISIKVEPIDRDIALIVADDLSPEAGSGFLAAFAQEQIDDARSSNGQIMGQVPSYEQTVDGRLGAALESVRPDGTIVAEFDLLFELFSWIGAQLVSRSPRRSGRYAQSHVFFVDGRETEILAAVPDARQYAFVNVLPYARKVERGLSAQAPDGVYQSVAAVAARRFGNIARIRFEYRAVAEGRRAKTDRNPAIVISLGR